VAGLVEVTRTDIPTVRRDVDTEVDLADAVRLGVGPATRAVLARMAGP
jgi:2-phospho-L-lactate guanylyltransferase